MLVFWLTLSSTAGYVLIGTIVTGIMLAMDYHGLMFCRANGTNQAHMHGSYAEAHNWGTFVRTETHYDAAHHYHTHTGNTYKHQLTYHGAWMGYLWPLQLGMGLIVAISISTYFIGRYSVYYLGLGFYKAIKGLFVELPISIARGFRGD